MTRVPLPMSPPSFLMSSFVGSRLCSPRKLFSHALTLAFTVARSILNRGPPTREGVLQADGDVDDDCCKDKDHEDIVLYPRRAAFMILETWFLHD